MTPLSSIATWLKGRECDRLVKQTGNEIVISGVSIGGGTYKIDIGSLSNKIKEFYRVPPIMVSLDSNQYLLCLEISKMEKNEEDLKDLCKRIRLQSILGLNFLQTLLSIPNPTDEINKEIVKWVKEMNKLNKQSIELLKPGPKMIAKGGPSNLSHILKYQGVSEEEMEKAIQILK